MISSTIIHSSSQEKNDLASRIRKFFPEVTFSQANHSLADIGGILNDPGQQLIFIDASLQDMNYNMILSTLYENKREVVLLIDPVNKDKIYRHLGVSGLIYRPFDAANIIVTVRLILQKIALANNSYAIKDIDKTSVIENVVGIPTHSAIEYINTKNIVRCEGLQKCSRIIMVDRKDIISSYSLGTFSGLLKPYGFELVHRSHLINLKKVVRYTREGYIYLCDNSKVPLSRRKKNEFLGLWTQL